MTTMRAKLFGGAAATLASLAVVLAAPASAGPDCSDIAPNTRMCTRAPGHTAIITSPDPAFTKPSPVWGFGTLGIPAFGIGGGGLWIGF